MTRTLFAAMSGLTFGLVLGVSGYHYHSHRCCSTAAAPQVAPVEKSLARPCAATAPAPIESPPLTTVPKDDSAALLDVDTQADQALMQARSLASKDPSTARQLCRKAMQLYNNNPRNPRVRAAFKLLNTIKMSDDDEF